MTCVLATASQRVDEVLHDRLAVARDDALRVKLHALHHICRYTCRGRKAGEAGGREMTGSHSSEAVHLALHMKKPTH